VDPGDTLYSAQDLPMGLILFRDRNGWCPYSERVWLAMLAKGLDFDEVLINLQVRPLCAKNVLCDSALALGRPVCADVMGKLTTMSKSREASRVGILR
jgi:hypothetical protein